MKFTETTQSRIQVNQLPRSVLLCCGQSVGQQTTARDSSCEAIILTRDPQVLLPLTQKLRVESGSGGEGPDAVGSQPGRYEWSGGTAKQSGKQAAARPSPVPHSRCLAASSCRSPGWWCHSTAARDSEKNSPSPGRIRSQ